MLENLNLAIHELLVNDTEEVLFDFRNKSDPLENYLPDQHLRGGVHQR